MAYYRSSTTIHQREDQPRGFLAPIIQQSQGFQHMHKPPLVPALKDPIVYLLLFLQLSV